MSTRALTLAPFALCLAATLVGARPAFPEEQPQLLAEERAAAVKRLEAVASWCHERKIFLQRDDAYRAILALSPEHELSRRTLGWVRRKGTWEREPSGQVRQDWNKGLVAEGAGRRADALAPYRDAVLALTDADNPRHSPEARAQLEEELVDLLPSDALLRKHRGDVQDGETWVLAETLAARKERARLRAVLKGLDPGKIEMEIDADAMGRGWKRGVSSGDFSVFGDVTTEECYELLLALHAGRDFAREILGATEHKASPAKVLLIPGKEAARAWLAQQGAAFEEARRIAPAVSGLWLPDGTFMRYHSDAVVRRVGAIRALMQHEVEGRVERSRDRGWIAEGLAQRLCWLVCGRHAPPVVATGATEGIGQRPDTVDLPPVDRSWLHAASQALATEPTTKLARALTCRLNAMSAEDVLVSYGLSAFLVEGRRESLLALLRSTQEQDDAKTQVATAVGVDLPDLAWRVRRWVKENADER